ncbi:hypothetical protein LEP1GSC084_1029 [Leptospira interrogans serovar Medanensis str. L0448]|uniref:hypothetical protein n=1 Tax=Leptospira interrogans TaxID=173 RepID=UPI0002985B2C|nr:hypothetical protein [Leptospira interrogans]EKR82577.1 hypothetical protein LEP1GSC099_1401 [Leptospira interrogans str. UI 08452]EMN33177.1 hypothetical protein LEP1GSC084_1029 [Leptospira interrogans serovar Medanensis str. L0448]
MKYSVFILLLITFSFSIYSDNQTVNNDPSELQQERKNKQRDEYLKVIKLFESLNQFKVEEDDNDVMKTKKKKLRQKEIISLNAKLKGLPISFASLELHSDRVDPFYHDDKGSGGDGSERQYIHEMNQMGHLHRSTFKLRYEKDYIYIVKITKPAEEPGNCHAYDDETQELKKNREKHFPASGYISFIEDHLIYIHDHELQKQFDEEERKALAEKQQEKIEEQKRNKQRDEYLKTIKLFESLNQFKVEEGDNDVMKAKKKRLRQKEIISLNAKLKGLPISFSSLISKSVTEETELSDYGKKELKNYIKKFRSDPSIKGLYDGEDDSLLKYSAAMYLAMVCGKKCEKKTGNLLANFDYWNRDTSGKEGYYYQLGEENYNLEYVKILTSEDEASKIKSNKYYNVSGKIDRFEYSEHKPTFADTIKLYIK